MTSSADEQAAYKLGYRDDKQLGAANVSLLDQGTEQAKGLQNRNPFTTVRAKTKDGVLLECYDVNSPDVNQVVARIASMTLEEFQKEKSTGKYQVISYPLNNDSLNKAAAVISEEHTGLSVNYYQVEITNPTTPGRAVYIAECNDIIEALNMPWPIANVFKACWRIAASINLGLTKKGNSNKYDAEKIVFYGERILKMFSKKEESMKP